MLHMSQKMSALSVNTPPATPPIAMVPRRSNFAADDWAGYFAARDNYLSREIYPSLAGEELREPLLRETDRVMFVPPEPEYAELYQMGVKLEDSNWNVAEVDFSHDLTDMAKLSKPELHFHLHVNGFFIVGDKVVNANLGEQILKRLKVPEAVYFGEVQVGQEAVHKHGYQKGLGASLKNVEEIKKIASELLKNPILQRKAQWLGNLATDDTPFAVVILAAATTELVFFSGAFRYVFYLKKKHLFPGFCGLNDAIMRDEGAHARFDVAIYLLLQMKLPIEVVHMLIGEAVDIECDFFRECFAHGEAPGLTFEAMTDYIRYVADSLCRMLQVPAIYNVVLSDESMKELGLHQVVDFFGHRVMEYTGFSVGEGLSASDRARLGEELLE